VATVLYAALGGNLLARDGGADQPAPTFSSDQIRFFETEVRPILKAHCLKCHGHGPKIRAGFRLDSRGAVLRGGELGPAVSAREPEKSRLLQAIRYEDLEMPPAGKLPAHDIDVLTRWVKEGLPWTTDAGASSAGRAVTARPAAAAPGARTARGSWSLRPVKRPAVPSIENREWCRNPIDAFLLSRLEGPRPTA
jgi:hypothetical protein